MKMTINDVIDKVNNSHRAIEVVRSSRTIVGHDRYDDLEEAAEYLEEYWNKILDTEVDI